MRRFPRRAALILVVGVAALVTGPGRPASVAADKACFGAAARDPEHPCKVGARRFTVTPTPYDAVLVPSSECTPQPEVKPEACSFGVPRAKAKLTVAVIGDSHAIAWRGALAPIAAKEGWHGLSVTLHNCPFTFAELSGDGHCVGWQPRVIALLHRHPEITTVFVAANATSGTVGKPGGGHHVRLRGFLHAFQALPDSVRHVVVLRDVPHATLKTPDCVTEQVELHHDAGVRCARPRSEALATDYAIKAAAKYALDRIVGIDLSPQICDRVRCFAVVGGVLVMRDSGHMTRAFAETLAPFVRREYHRLADAPGAIIG